MTRCEAGKALVRQWLDNYKTAADWQKAFYDPTYWELHVRKCAQCRQYEHEARAARFGLHTPIVAGIQSAVKTSVTA